MLDLSRASEPEQRLYYDVISPTIAPEADKFVLPQYVIHEDLGNTRRIDFAVVTVNTKLAIELDGYTYHAEGIVTREKFSDDLYRQNQLMIQGWKVLRFSWDDVLHKPERCRDTLRRAIVSDPDLHPGHQSKDINPHVIQQEALASLDATRRLGKTKGLVVMATGLGKTYLAAFDARRIGGRILFVVHSNSILEQARDAFLKIMPGRSVGLYNAYEKKPREDLVFANIASLRNPDNLKSFDPREFSYIVFDEFHHGATEHYRNAIAYFRPKFMLGMTATPERTDKQSILGLMDDNLLYHMTQTEAIDRGFLVPFKYYALSDNVDYSNIRHNGFRYDVSDLNKTLIIEHRDHAIIDKYRTITGEKKAIAFCVSIEHAVRSAEHFRQEGIPSVAIHSKMSAETRRSIILEFREGLYRVIFVRDLFNEGIDFPEVEALLFIRPTESKNYFYSATRSWSKIEPE